jgi:hypothetical protein
MSLALPGSIRRQKRQKPAAGMEMTEKFRDIKDIKEI